MGREAAGVEGQGKQEAPEGVSAQAALVSAVSGQYSSELSSTLSFHQLGDWSALALTYGYSLLPLLY